MPVLTFQQRHLRPTLSGKKRSTVRQARAVPRAMRPGAALTMQFGRRDAPTTLDTTITAVDLYPLLDWYEALEAREEAQAGSVPFIDLTGAELHAAIRAAADAEGVRLVALAERLETPLEQLLSELIEADRRVIYEVFWDAVTPR